MPQGFTLSSLYLDLCLYHHKKQTSELIILYVGEYFLSKFCFGGRPMKVVMQLNVIVTANTETEILLVTDKDL